MLPKWWNKKNMKKESSEQEKQLAKEMKGRTTKNSGADKWDKGDVEGELNNISFLVECKRTDKKSFPITIDILDKIEREAKKKMKLPMVEIQIKNKFFLLARKKDIFEVAETCQKCYKKAKEYQKFYEKDKKGFV